MKALRDGAVTVVLVCAFLLSMAQTANAVSRGDLEELVRLIKHCVALKGANHPSCIQLQQQLIIAAYDRLDELKKRYAEKCSDPKEEDIEYCEKLKEEIEQLERELEDYTGQRSSQQSMDKAHPTNPDPHATSLGGVDMLMRILNRSFEFDSTGSIDSLRDALIKSRPRGDSLQWPAPTERSGK